MDEQTEHFINEEFSKLIKLELLKGKRPDNEKFVVSRIRKCIFDDMTEYHGFTEKATESELLEIAYREFKKLHGLPITHYRRYKQGNDTVIELVKLEKTL